MAWYVYLAYIVAGAFLANGVPHFVMGISGSKFQSPFAKPPGVGESSPLVNVLWGMANFAIGYILIYWVGGVVCGFSLPVLLVFIGALATAGGLALHFGKVRGA